MYNWMQSGGYYGGVCLLMAIFHRLPGSVFLYPLVYRWLNGDGFIISLVEKVADIALQGRTTLIEKDCNTCESQCLTERNLESQRQKYLETTPSVL
ncbi:hypothetical protein OROHE_027190 [Orobanche hederae]